MGHDGGMTHPADGRADAVAEILRDVVAAVDDGRVEATDEQRAFLAGALGASTLPGSPEDDGGTART